MKNAEILRLKQMYKNIYDGAAWHGHSITKILSDVSEDTAFKKLNNMHSIAELVMHMVAWRKFVAIRLEGNPEYEVTDNENWPDIEGTHTWHEVVLELASSQINLMDLLDQVEDTKLLEMVDDKSYNYYTMIHGSMQHDLYHLGEIALLKRLLVA